MEKEILPEQILKWIKENSTREGVSEEIMDIVRFTISQKYQFDLLEEWEKERNAVKKMLFWLYKERPLRKNGKPYLELNIDKEFPENMPDFFDY